MSIQPLPQEVIAQIKSSIAIISLNAVICELFKNSLDARATRIDITVDQAKGACIVEDDGFGILPSEFGEHSGLGKLYRRFSSHTLSAHLLTEYRLLKTAQHKPDSWKTWHISCVSVRHVSVEYCISSSVTSFAQHDHHAQIGSCCSPNTS